MNNKIGNKPFNKKMEYYAKSNLFVVMQGGCQFKIESTTGDLLKEVKKLNLLDNDKYIKYKTYLPLLNVYNHVNDNYGLRRVDCNEIKMKAMFDYLNTF